jgi:phage gp36-like protein
MAYCVQADLEARVGKEQLALLTNDTAGTELSDPTVISALIERADTIVDARMTGLYATPFDPVPKIIKQCSVDIALYNAFLRRFASTEVPKEWVATYKQATDILDLIANLEIQLDTNPSVSSSEADIVSPVRLIDFNDSDNAASNY